MVQRPALTALDTARHGSVTHRRMIRATAFLGPEGTFTHAALQDYDKGMREVPANSVGEALAMISRGQVHAAMLPIENSVEGGVPATLDALARSRGLAIVGEHLMPVTFVLATMAGTSWGDVRAVGTHPHAWAQVGRFARTRLPGATFVPVPSTAAAARDLAQGCRTFQATVCAPSAAIDHGLHVLARDIGDVASAKTRFVLVGPRHAVPAPTGCDKTTILVRHHLDGPGTLPELIGSLARRGIVVTRFDSRPTGAGMGSYCFSIDLEGHLRDEPIAQALLELRQIGTDIRFLGSYPRVVSPRLTSQVAPRSAATARAWLRSLAG